MHPDRGSWRVPLRMARRTAWRERGRASMVVLLIALPVAGVAGASIAASTAGAVKVRAAVAAVGHADAIMEWSGSAAKTVNLFGDPDPNPQAVPAATASTPSVSTGRHDPLTVLPTGSRRKSSSSQCPAYLWERTLG